MNRNGFTLIELLAVIIVLSVIAGVTLVASNYSFGNAKEKTEDVYIKTLRDSVGIYLNSDGKSLEFNSSSVCTVSKMLENVRVYESVSEISFNDIINSTYRPITSGDMVNPANNEKCSIGAKIRIFRDDDYVYYYLFSGSALGCLDKNKNEVISNLPEGCNL